MMDASAPVHTHVNADMCMCYRVTFAYKFHRIITILPIPNATNKIFLFMVVGMYNTWYKHEEREIEKVFLMLELSGEFIDMNEMCNIIVAGA